MRSRFAPLPHALLACLCLALWACSSGDERPADAGAVDIDANSSQHDSAAEGGEGDGQAEDSNADLCEQLGLSGDCDGEVLRFCAFGELEQRDCAAEFTAMGLVGGCVFVSDAWGYDCALAAGQPCVDQAGNSAVCDGATSGCFMGADGRYTCRVDVGACDPDVAPPKRCDGQLLLDVCEVTGQFFGIDCVAFGGRCDEALGACVDLAEATACDGDKRRCAEGLNCRDGLCAQE